VTIVSDKDEFLFKPNTIYIPFGADPASLRFGLQKPARRRDIDFVHGAFEELDTDARRVRAGGRDLSYDFLVLATGAAMAPGEVPGLAEYAETIWTPAEMEVLGERLGTLVAQAAAGVDQRVLFVVPPNNKCAGPLYEIVFMLETWLRRKKVRDRVSIVYTTYEKSFIQAFGPKLHDVVVEEFASRGIIGYTDRRIVEAGPEEAVFEGGPKEPYDLLIAFPPYVSAVRYPGLPADDRGFLGTEDASRRVVGYDNVYAPGDAGDFPVKQAFLAFLQADAAAEDISARVLGTEPRAAFDPVSMCVMEQFDKATFAQVPLQTTGDPDQPVIVRPEANGDYRVGVSPAWRLGKKMLGLYLPYRFKAGQPFHAGAPWKAMEIGLKGMSATLARR
jgi:NADH dehydrogenase FAD-containing subunit